MIKPAGSVWIDLKILGQGSRKEVLLDAYTRI
jgi:hypothetical protein